MNKPLRTIILVVLAIVIVGAGAYALSTKKALSPSSPVAEEPASDRRYTNFTHDLRFTYPAGYVLTEQEVGNAERGHYQVMLVRQADAVPPVNGEGPTAVTVDIYQNDLDKRTVMDWITGTNDSNYKLGDGKLATSRVAGTEAQTYTWSGLYEGRTTVLAHEDDIIAISVTRLGEEKDLATVYDQVLRTLEFGDFKP